MEHVIIIGGGGTGAALAHDLVLRGFDVSLFERGELLSPPLKSASPKTKSCGVSHPRPSNKMTGFSWP